MTSVNKAQFAILNDKRYYFSDGILSLPFGHPPLSKFEIIKSLCRKYILLLRKKKKLLQLENKIVNNNERLRILRSIFFTTDNML